MPVPVAYCTDHLFLLVGMNPLPNFVAATLMTYENSAVYLLHSAPPERNSRGISHTKQIAEFLARCLRVIKPGIRIESYPLHEADGRIIQGQLRDILRNERIAGSVGFNYTSGTKPMALHAYDVLHRRFKHNLVCSYLDARQLALFIDDAPGNPYPANDELEVRLQDLALLHGFSLKMSKAEPRDGGVVRALAAVHTTKAGEDQWQAWWGNEFQQGLFPDGEKYPQLYRVVDAFAALCEGNLSTEVVARRLLNKDRFASCAKYFRAEWLEDWALQAVLENAKAFGIKHYGTSVEPTPMAGTNVNIPNFEIDVAAMIGYQLFAISCIASSQDRSEIKKHLFEIYTRARQLGGDEARAALVCLVDDPQDIEDEINRTWYPAGRLRVFGRRDLANLPNEFRVWFDTANR